MKVIVENKIERFSNYENHYIEIKVFVKGEVIQRRIDFPTTAQASFKSNFRILMEYAIKEFEYKVMANEYD